MVLRMSQIQKLHIQHYCQLEIFLPFFFLETLMFLSVNLIKN
ncbi:hypothetical protein Q427_13120 [Halomonas sp. BC04]|nr:hypothetical protein Q427_13120 [Halomonas sp. BC04]